MKVSTASQLTEYPGNSPAEKKGKKEGVAYVLWYLESGKGRSGAEDEGGGEGEMEHLPLPLQHWIPGESFFGAHCADILSEGGALKFPECLLSCRGRYSPIPVWKPQVQRIAPALASSPPLTGVTRCQGMPGNLSQ